MILSISLLASGLLFTTQTKAFTAAYNPSTSDAMATSPKIAAAPPMYCSVVATGLGTNVLTPEHRQREWIKIYSNQIFARNNCENVTATFILALFEL